MVVHLNCVNFRHNLSIFNKWGFYLLKNDGFRPKTTGCENGAFFILHKFNSYGKPAKQKKNRHTGHGSP